MKPLQIKDQKSIFDMLSLKGKVAFVTGAGGGIGRASAAALADVGANVALMDIPQKKDVLIENCKAIEERYHVKAIPVVGNVADETDVIRMIDEVVKEFGLLDVVFSNAGIGGIQDNPREIALDTWNKLLTVNQTGMFLVDRTAANKMAELGNGGSIINTASMSGHIINKMSREHMKEHMCAYAATKAAVIQLTKSVAASYVTDNIRCNSISPGMILSGLHDNMDMNALMEFVHDEVPMDRFASLDEIVGIVVFLASELSSYATGSDFVIDGGVTIW